MLHWHLQSQPHIPVYSHHTKQNIKHLITHSEGDRSARKCSSHRSLSSAMATSAPHLPLRPILKAKLQSPPQPPSPSLTLPISSRRNRAPTIRSSQSPPLVEQPGGKMVVELVGAFNELTERMGSLSTTSSSRLLFMSLKLSIPLLHPLPLAADGRPPLSRAFSVACLLADLQMDAEVISAGILREALEVGAITMEEVKNQIGMGTAHLLHESLRIRNVPFNFDISDDESASALRKYCLTYYDIRAVILELALKLDAMRNLEYLPRYQQQMVSLQAMKIYAPLAHAVGAGALSQEMEDLSFHHLFPCSYLYVDTWLKSLETENKPLIDVSKERLLEALNTDVELGGLVDGISIQGRYKSRFSTMKKLLRDGRKREEVNDILGLRVILNPRSGDNIIERGLRSCYRTHEIIQTLWDEVPGRTKDYIARPKANGYRSLHVSVDVSEHGRVSPLMEVQIRTTEMDEIASGGAASHSLYKGGLTDPGEVVSSSSRNFLIKAVFNQLF